MYISRTGTSCTFPGLVHHVHFSDGASYTLPGLVHHVHFSDKYMMYIASIVQHRFQSNYVYLQFSITTSVVILTTSWTHILLLDIVLKLWKLCHKTKSPFIGC